MNKILPALAILILSAVSILYALESEKAPVTVLFTSDTSGRIKPYG